MSIVQTQTTSFKYELYQGIHDFLTDTFYMALYTGNANLDNTVTAYTTLNEVNAIGYVPGGNSLSGATVNFDLTSNTAYINFNNLSWSGADFITRCALIYNSSKSNRSVAVIDFGSDKQASGIFTVTMPANTPSTALIRSS